MLLSTWIALFIRTWYYGPMSTEPTIKRACELIGHEGTFKLPGGHATYEAVMYNEARTDSYRPRLARLESTPEGIHQVNRYVDWDQPIEVIEDLDAEEDDL
jgi:hypothetical protein